MEAHRMIQQLEVPSNGVNIPATFSDVCSFSLRHCILWLLMCNSKDIGSGFFCLVDSSRLESFKAFPMASWMVKKVCLKSMRRMKEIYSVRVYNCEGGSL